MELPHRHKGGQGDQDHRPNPCHQRVKGNDIPQNQDDDSYRQSPDLKTKRRMGANQLHLLSLDTLSPVKPARRSFGRGKAGVEIRGRR